MPALIRWPSTKIHWAVNVRFLSISLSTWIILLAVHCASTRGHATCVRVLIEHFRCPIEGLLTQISNENHLTQSNDDLVEDVNGCTALFYALTFGHNEVCHVLLDFRADPNHQDNRGRTSVTFDDFPCCFFYILIALICLGQVIAQHRKEIFMDWNNWSNRMAIFGWEINVAIIRFMKPLFLSPWAKICNHKASVFFHRQNKKKSLRSLT